MLADLQSVEGMADRAAKQVRLGGPDAKRRLEILNECQALLAEGKPVRGLKYEDATSALILRDLQLITSKRVLYVANVGEADLAGGNPMVEKVRSPCGRRRERSRACSARDSNRRLRNLTNRIGQKCCKASAWKSRHSPC